VSSTQAITNHLNDADGIAAILGACWDAFEYIGHVADKYARPESDPFAAFVFAACAASEGRDAVGRVPSLPARSAIADWTITVDETEPDTAARILAALAAQAKTKLAVAASLSGGPADRRAVLDASRCAAEIVDLLG
jgi:hypothetical protein